VRPQVDDVADAGQADALLDVVGRGRHREAQADRYCLL
jgi:hypothetical protein